MSPTGQVQTEANRLAVQVAAVPLGGMSVHVTMVRRGDRRGLLAWQDEAMGRRADRRDPIWQFGPALFAFLEEAGFLGPERTEDGLAYHQPGLHIEIRLVGGLEPEVATTVTVTTSTSDWRWANLDCLYVACGCGPLQDVPGNVPNQKIAAKRVRQHAEALRRVLPWLVGADVERLVRRCQGRLVPDP